MKIAAAAAVTATAGADLEEFRRFKEEGFHPERGEGGNPSRVDAGQLNTEE